MNTVITSREAILAACREHVTEAGLESLNIRGIAQKCGISVGAVYHYFPSKASLVSAAIEEIWRSIFHTGDCVGVSDGFPEYVERIFGRVRAGIARYPNFFTVHSLVLNGGEKDEARQVMEHYFSHMRAGLLAALEQDTKIAPGVFSDTFSREGFADFILSELLSLLVRREAGCSVLTEVVRRTIY